MCGHDLVCRTRLQGSELGLKAGSNSLGSAITMTRRPDDRLGPQRLSRSFLARYRRTSAGADENDKCENRMQLTFGRARPSVCPYGLDSGHYFSHVPNGRSGSSSADHLRQHAAHLPPFSIGMLRSFQRPLRARQRTCEAGLASETSTLAPHNVRAWLSASPAEPHAKRKVAATF